MKSFISRSLSAADPASEPEFIRIDDLVLHVAIMDVELRLLFQEIVQVILPPPRVPALADC